MDPCGSDVMMSFELDDETLIYETGCVLPLRLFVNQFSGAPYTQNFAVFEARCYHF